MQCKLKVVQADRRKKESWEKKGNKREGYSPAVDMDEGLGGWGAGEGGGSLN